MLANTEKGRLCLQAGEAVIAFDPAPLNNGTYIVVVEREGERILAEKFVIGR